MEAVTDTDERLEETSGTRLSITAGRPAPLGPTVTGRSESGRLTVNLAVVSSHASAVTLCLYRPGVHEAMAEIPLDPARHRTGHVWHASVDGLDPSTRYGYRVRGEPSDAPAPFARPGHQPPPEPEAHGIDPDCLLLDPYAQAITGVGVWGTEVDREGTPEDLPPGYRPRALLSVPEYDWGDDRPLDTPIADTVIYELHVRGFTRDPSSRVQYPGTYSGLAEKIPYLLELGVTAVELLPIHEFNERENQRHNPLTGERLFNYWGYSTVNFFAPKAAFAAQSGNGAQVREFRDMVRTFHAAGIEVYLDVVYNHTAEGNVFGPTLSFKGFDNATYYILDPITRQYHNYSGCGNTVNCNHPVVQDLIIDSLRYWVTEMHVDGFRFDLASILCRGQDGAVLNGPPILARISADPVLARTKLIAEAWDAAGLYQVGNFPHYGRWAEWNGKYRDDVRRFVKGDAGMVEALAARLTGSPDLYESAGRRPTDSVNFVTAHDGFTLHDVVSYNSKHNDANGELNRDGSNATHSWNCGVEGVTEEERVRKLRLQQMKNLVAILLTSHGTPMFVMGDELARTQGGNNNAYCQDNEISWMDWTQSAQQNEIHRFFRVLLEWRKRSHVFRPEEFVRETDGRLNGVTWHGVQLRHPDWGHQSRSLAAEFVHPVASERFYLIANAHTDALTFELPQLAKPQAWCRVIDTSLPWPRDIAEPGQEAPCFEQALYHVPPRSTVLLVVR